MIVFMVVNIIISTVDDNSDNSLDDEKRKIWDVIEWPVWKSRFINADSDFYNGIDGDIDDNDQYYQQQHKKKQNKIKKKKKKKKLYFNNQLDQYHHDCFILYKQINKDIRIIFNRIHMDIIDHFEQILMAFKYNKENRVSLSNPNNPKEPDLSLMIDQFQILTLATTTFPLLSNYYKNYNYQDYFYIYDIDIDKSLKIIFKDSFYRLMGHGICQFHNLKSSSYTDYKTKQRIMTITRSKKQSQPIDINQPIYKLSNYLQLLNHLKQQQLKSKINML